MDSRKYHSEFYPVDMNGCVLYLPFHRYGAEQSKIWDQSGLQNHGTITGPVPATYPKLSGKELMTNGGFDSTTDGWSGADGTILSVAGGQSGNCCELTRVAEVDQRAQQTLSTNLTEGNYYLLKGCVKSGTSGNETFRLQISGVWVTGTSSGSWTYYALIFVATAAQTVMLRKMSATPGTMLFDSISVQEVTGYEGLGWYFDGVDDTVVVAHNATQNFSTGVTILAWLQPNSYAHARIIQKGSTPGIYFNIFDVSTELYLGSQLVGGRSLNFQKWNFVSASSDYSTVLMGANGVFNSPVAYTGTLNYGTSNIETSTAGKRIYGEVLLFNRVLSAVEIKSYYDLTRSRYGV